MGEISSIAAGTFKYKCNQNTRADIETIRNNKILYTIYSTIYSKMLK